MIYEPRSLWSIGYVTRTGGDPAAVIRLDRQHFMNGGRYPITLERIAVTPVNYIVRRTGNAPTATVPQYSSAIINQIRVSISAPFRQHYSGSQQFSTANMAPLPTYTPPVRTAVNTYPQPSSIWGVTALNFDHTLDIPRDGQLEWGLNPVPASGRGGANIIDTSETQMFMLFQESGVGKFSGNTRGTGWRYLNTQTTLLTPGAQRETTEPFMTDPVGQVVGIPAQLPGGEGGPLDYVSPRDAGLKSAEFSRQSASSPQQQKPGQPSEVSPSKFTGMRAMVNQIAYDATCNGVGFYPGDPVEPISNRLGVRARNISGSGDWWWRSGAPMSLVMDTITPALVYRLPSAITLSPGDTLDVQIEVPGIADAQVGDNVPTQIGVSLNGFAIIEG